MIAILILSTNTIYATLKRLNNNPGTVADYATIDAAISGQATWDTLYVEPSATTYNLVTNTISGGFGGSSFIQGYINAPNKVIVGNGYFLDNGNINYTPPPLQSNKLSSNIGANIIGQTIQSVMLGNNTTCIGLNFQTKIRQQQLLAPYTVNGVNIVSCQISEGISFITTQNISNTNSTVSNIKIRKCFIFKGIEFQLQDPLNYFNVNNFTCENNIILATNNNSISMNFNATDFVFRNNVCTKGYYCRNAYCANNIFIDSDTTHYFFMDNNVKNNIFVAPTFSLSNAANAVNNQFNVNQSTLFNPLNIFGGQDADYYLANFSPAIGAGVPNGATPVDCGAFGGPDPYKLSGIPPFPTIYELSVPAVIPAGTQMNITLSTRSNN